MRDRGGRSDRGQRRHRQQDRNVHRRGTGARARSPVLRRRSFSTIDVATKNRRGDSIEERSAAEVTDIGTTRIAPDGISVRHPAFDVTPARLITAIITTAEFFARHTPVLSFKLQEVEIMLRMRLGIALLVSLSPLMAANGSFHFGK